MSKTQAGNLTVTSWMKTGNKLQQHLPIKAQGQENSWTGTCDAKLKHYKARCSLVPFITDNQSLYPTIKITSTTSTTLCTRTHVHKYTTHKHSLFFQGQTSRESYICKQLLTEALSIQWLSIYNNVTIA